MRYSVGIHRVVYPTSTSSEPRRTVDRQKINYRLFIILYLYIGIYYNVWRIIRENIPRYNIIYLNVRYGPLFLLFFCRFFFFYIFSAFYTHIRTRFFHIIISIDYFMDLIFHHYYLNNACTLKFITSQSVQKSTASPPTGSVSKRPITDRYIYESLIYLQAIIIYIII